MKKHSINYVPGLICIIFGASLFLSWVIDGVGDARTKTIERLNLLPRGEILKPSLLGYHHLGADLLWLQIVQVIGERHVTEEDYSWLRHALDTTTTLDEHYVYAYDAGGTILTGEGNRVDWSNELLEKGFKANPQAWRLPFLLGFNHFFHQEDYVGAAGYLVQATRVPGHPPFIDFLASRLYVEGNSPIVALHYLEGMIQSTTDEDLRDSYRERYKQIEIVRDIQLLERARSRFVETYKKDIKKVSDLVSFGLVLNLPVEPFGGEYRLDEKNGDIVSSTHPEKLRLFRPSDNMANMKHPQ